MVRSGIYHIVPERDLAKLDDRVLRLPEWRRRKALSYQRPIDRLQCALAYDLLEALLLDAFGLYLRDHEIVYDEMGKPSLRGYPDCHFSLGHCPAGVIAVVADSPVGCDIEEIRRPYEDNCREIEEYCFPPRKESSWLNQRIPPWNSRVYGLSRRRCSNLTTGCSSNHSTQRQQPR